MENATLPSDSVGVALIFCLRTNKYKNLSLIYQLLDDYSVTTVTLTA